MINLFNPQSNSYNRPSCAHFIDHAFSIGPLLNCSTPSSEPPLCRVSTGDSGENSWRYKASQPFFKTLPWSCPLKVTFLMKAKAGHSSHSPLSNFAKAFATLYGAGGCTAEACFLFSFNSTVCRGSQRDSNTVSNLLIPRSPYSCPGLRGCPGLIMMGNVKPQFPQASHGVIISLFKVFKGNIIYIHVYLWL